MNALRIFRRPSPLAVRAAQPAGSIGRRSLRGSGRVLLLGLTAMSSVVVGAGPANASGVGADGQQVDTSAFCDYSTGLMTVTAAGTQMMSDPAFEDGQWVRFRVYTRNVTDGIIGPWYLSSDWSSWGWLDATFYVGEVRIVQPQTIGEATLYGAPGNAYEVAVEYDHWAGYSVPVLDPSTRYQVWYDGMIMYPSTCHF